jgi:hypothetical protein
MQQSSFLLLFYGVSIAMVFIDKTALSFPQHAAFVSRCRPGSSRWNDFTFALEAKARKAKQTKKAERSRPQQFFEAIEEAQGKKAGKSSSSSSTVATSDEPKKDRDSGDQSQEDVEREARMAEARRRMEERPDVSTMLMDEETGMEVVAQGKSVMDVVTRKAVKLSSLGPQYRLAQMFPGVPPDVRENHRVDWSTANIPEVVERLQEACSVTLEDGTRGVPPHPSVANSGIDFVLANRDNLGRKMKQTLGRLTLRAMSDGNKDQARRYQKLWKNYLTLENHISAPFRQMIMDAEGRVGPNFGNLDLLSFCRGEMHERCANYLVLKGMVAHWEKKVVDADRVEKTPQTKSNYISVMSIGDPRRYLPDPPILFTLRECTQVCLMAQQMTKAFVETPELFDDLPPEIRFLEQALAIRGATPLRKFIIDDFCPKEGLTPEALREGMRRLLVQLENMQVDPYADITNILERLIIAMSIGTPDGDRDPYAPFLLNKDPNGPGGFQTYTFNHEKLSLVRFLDSQYERSGAAAETPATQGLGSIFSFGAPSASTPSASWTSSGSEGDRYNVPAVRAARRPHELGWLDLLKDEKDEQSRFGKVPPGRIIVE